MWITDTLALAIIWTAALGGGILLGFCVAIGEQWLNERRSHGA